MKMDWSKSQSMGLVFFLIAFLFYSAPGIGIICHELKHQNTILHSHHQTGVRHTNDDHDSGKFKDSLESNVNLVLVASLKDTFKRKSFEFEAFNVVLFGIQSDPFIEFDCFRVKLKREAFRPPHLLVLKSSHLNKAPPPTIPS